MFEQIAKVEAWVKRNGPAIREQIEDVAINCERVAVALETIAQDLTAIRRARFGASPDEHVAEVIEGEAIEID